MLTKIRERTQDALLRYELLCGEANFRSLAEAIACAIFISQGKRLQYVNHAAEIITGYAREELLSMNFWDLVHPDCRELVLKRGGADRELYGMKSPCGEEPTPLVRSFVSSPGRLVHKKTSSRKRDQVYDSPEGEAWIH